MTIVRKLSLWSFVAILVVLVACGEEEPTPVPTTEEPTPEPPTAVPVEPESFPAQVTEYNLGETTILQAHFPEDSPFRNMPVRLEGVIGLPGGEGAHPVVLIMQGSHASCPGENVWPCSAEEEQKNYEGFTYLVRAVAEAGYVALSINVNAEHTFGFGEAPPTVRTKQLIDLHLGELAAANVGESDKFGLNLTGRIDPTRMTWLGHSRGGEFANWILRDQETAFGNAFEEVQGLIQVAPSAIVVDSLPAADRALATILPACDQDVINLEGQRYFETARLDLDREQLATTVYLEGADHNGFNAVLDAEREDPPEDRPDCAADNRLDHEEQQDFLIRYTIDFLKTLYGDSDSVHSASQNLGVSPTEASPEELFGYPARVIWLPAPDGRLDVVRPQSDAELSQNLLGGEIQLIDATAIFCPDGYYVPSAKPGSEPCKRVNFNQPGFPQQFVVSWDTPGAQWRTKLPEAYVNLEGFDALQLRVALDPLSERNAQNSPQSFSIELVEAGGSRASVVVKDVEFPAGVQRENGYFEGGLFTGHVHMQTVLFPLAAFDGVDLSDITEIALLFNQTPNGTIFLADLELIKSGL